MAGAFVAIAGAIISSKMSGDAQDDAIDAQNAANEAAAEENAKISRYDAAVARQSAKNIMISGNQDLALKVNQLKRLKATTKSGYAARGVAVNTGSALNQQQTTTQAVKNDMRTIAYNTKKNYLKSMSAAERYEMLAAAGLRGAADQAQAYEEAAKAQNANMWAETAIGAASTIADYYNKGAFDNLFSSGMGGFQATTVDMSSIGGGTAWVGQGGTTAYGF